MASSTNKSPASLWRFFPFLVILVMLIIVIYGFSLAPPQFRVSFIDPTSAPMCLDGQKQYCRVANCSGLSTCRAGTWGGCEWTKICNPSERVPCLKEGCSYAYKVCNECGTEYGVCTGFNETQNLINENTTIIN